MGIAARFRLVGVAVAVEHAPRPVDQCDMLIRLEGESTDDVGQQNQSLCRGQDMDRPAIFIADRDADVDGEVLFTGNPIEDVRNVGLPGTAHPLVPITVGEVLAEDLRAKGVAHPDGALAVGDDQGCELRVFLCQTDQMFQRPLGTDGLSPLEPTGDASHRTEGHRPLPSDARR